MHGLGGSLFWGHLRCPSFPHQHWQRMPARLGAGGEHSPCSALPARSRAVCPSRPASGGRASHAGRDAGQGARHQPLPGPAAPGRAAPLRAPGPAAVPVVGSRAAEPTRALGCLSGCAVTAAPAQPARRRPGHSRGAALAGAGGDVSPAPVPPLPPPGAARSNSHGNPSSTRFPNPASAPRPAAPARRPPAVGNSPCTNSTCPERCAPLPASLRARSRGLPAENDAGPFLQRGGVR